VEVVSKDLEMLMYQHLDNGNEDEAINTAIRIPTSWRSFEKLATTRKLSERSIAKIIQKLMAHPNKDNLKSFIFEISHNLPETLSSKSLNNIAYFGKDSDYVFNNIQKHPNWSFTEPFQSLNLAREFWRHNYELSQNPSALATLKSMATNKSESLKDPKGKEGSSNEFVSMIPALKGYAKALQAELNNDNNIPKTENMGQNYINLFKPLTGASAKMVREAILNDRDGLKKFVLPIYAVSSWISDLDEAKRIASDKGTGIIISKFIPISSIVYSTDHKVVHGAPHENLDTEMIVLNPEGKISFNANDVSLESEDGKFDDHDNDDVIKSEYEELRKNRRAMAGVLAAASMLGLPSYTTQHEDFSRTPMSHHEQNVIKPAPGLNIIKQLESSGGKDISHDVVQTGLNAGTSAAGNYGLMPLTIIETVSKNPHLRTKYPDIANSDYKMNQDYIKDFISKNPDAENEIANSHWRRLGHKFDNDENKMAHAWFNGITNTLRSDPEDVKNHFYVKRYNKFKKLFDLENKPLREIAHFRKSENDKGIEGFSSIFSEDANIGKMINSFIEKGLTHDLSNIGHFTHTSIIAGNDPKNSWLIKGEPTNAPAVKSAKNGLQSSKEVAFYNIATKVFNFDQKFFPRAILGEISLHKKRWPAAAIHMLDNSFIPAVELHKKDKQQMAHVLSPLLKSGDIHKLGVMYYILGEADAHGQNMLTDGKELKMIDHGTSFSDETFEPSQDNHIFIPYFFRVGKIKDRMSNEDKYSHMPLISDINVRSDLKHWLLSIDGQAIRSELEKIGIDAEPSVSRLNKVKELISASDRPDEVINRLWTIGIGENNDIN
jgi:hypothetical protein